MFVVIRLHLHQLNLNTRPEVLRVAHLLLVMVIPLHGRRPGARVRPPRLNAIRFTIPPRATQRSAALAFKGVCHDPTCPDGLGGAGACTKKSAACVRLAISCQTKNFDRLAVVIVSVRWPSGDGNAMKHACTVNASDTEPTEPAWDRSVMSMPAHYSGIRAWKRQRNDQQAPLIPALHLRLRPPFEQGIQRSPSVRSWTVRTTPHGQRRHFFIAR